MIDLAARWLGGGVVAASDESFGLKENLLVPGPAVFEPGHFDHRGEVVDGWETQRRRFGGHDWAIVRLGAAGVVSEVDVDTSFFTGNVPATCSVEAVCLPGHPSAAELQAADWRVLVPETPLVGDGHNLLTVTDEALTTHVRLSAFPDGGVARLRVWGTVIPDPGSWAGVSVELSSLLEGARLLSSSDDFYTSAASLLRPDSAVNMGDGWETARRRSGDRDSAVVLLATAGRIRRVEIDTTHFKYNASSGFALWGAASATDPNWVELVPRTPLQPDTRHRFSVSTAEVSVVRLDAFPDGGMARLRLTGDPSEAGIAAARKRWTAALVQHS